ncbi:MAG TPA: nucleotidyltransferase domain-containing protein [Thermoleophilia bacterium]|nr:nucleotidyltransferase domain-containing protein [Thermoleophilia bacterium]
MIHIDFSREELEAICRRRAVKRLALFGSVLRDDFGPDSDVDVLVEFDPEAPDDADILPIFDELAVLFGGHRIDLVEVEFLNPRMKKALQRNVEELYAA